MPTISLFKNVYAKPSDHPTGAARPLEVDWLGLCALLKRWHVTEATEAAKLLTPAWSPAELNYLPGEKRANENVKAIHFAVFDLDPPKKRKEESPESLAIRVSEWRTEFGATLARIDGAPVAALVHTTWSHTPERPAARVVFKLSRSMLPGEWPIVRPAIERMFQLKHDVDGTKDLCRLYFLPATSNPATSAAAMNSATEPIDVDVLIAHNKNVKIDTQVKAALALAPLPPEAASVDMALCRKFLRTVHNEESKAIMKTVLAGEPLADVGGRDNAIQRAASIIGATLPIETPISAMLEIMRESLNLMDPPEPGAKFATWHEFAAEKLERAKIRKYSRDLVWQAQQQSERDVLMGEAFKSSSAIDRQTNDPEQEDDQPAKTIGPYTPAQVQDWAQEQGCETLEQFNRRWIIQRASSYYVFCEGRYLSPITREEMPTSLRRDLARAPISLNSTDKSGNERPRSVSELLSDYSTVARAVEGSLALQNSFYSPVSQTYYEAVCPLRRIIPRAWPEINEWLLLLGGEKLLDWVASVSRLDRQSAAVYLDGPAGIGKTLLASGLARLWTTGGASELGRCLEGFNESLVSCPLVFADESLPARKGISAELRRFIGSTSRTLNRKFLPAVPLNGAVRVLIAGNNDQLLDNGETMSSNDLEAVAGRFLYIKCNRAPAEFLKAIGGPPVLEHWIKRDRMAEHSLYLKGTRKIDESARFLVEGDPSAFHDHLATTSGLSGLVCEWLVRFLIDPSSQPSAHLQFGNGEIWINTEALAKESTWAQRVPSAKVPSAANLGRALRSLASGTITAAIDGKSQSYHRLNGSLIVAWSERLQVGDSRTIESRITQPNPRMEIAP